MESQQPQISDVKLLWLGHAGFKLTFNADGTERVIYIDTWLGNPKLPDVMKNEAGEPVMPTDADLVLVTHGHFDHASSAADIQKASTKADCAIVAGYELCQFYVKRNGVPEANARGMGRGGTFDFGFAKVTMTSADHSSSCGFTDDGCPMYSGGAAGFVIRLANGVSIYHAGDTGVFGDMRIIDDLYKPTHLLLPIGGNFTMGPEEAAYAVKNFLTTATTIIPMHFMTFPLLKGDYPEFVAECERQGVAGKTIVNSYQDALGKWLSL